MLSSNITADENSNLGCVECGAFPTIKAHIIPQGFARLIRTTNSSVLEVTERGAFRAKNQNGFFDTDILCAECDGKIGLLDNWAITYCQTLEFKNTLIDYQPINLPDFDPELACRFAVSVFFRSSLCRQQQFSGIQLGPYLGIARDIVFGRVTAKSCAQLHVQVHILTDSHIDTMSHITLPIQVKGKSGSYLIFAAGGMYWLVRFGNTAFGEAEEQELVEKLSISRSLPSVAIALPIRDTADWDTYIKAINAKRKLI